MAHRFQHVKCAQGVNLKIFPGILYRSRNGDLTGQMQHDIRSADSLGQRFIIANVAFDELDTAVMLLMEPRERVEVTAR